MTAMLVKSENKYNDLDEDAWVSETCTLALQLLVDLFVKFYDSVNHLLGKVMEFLTNFIKQRVQSLAGIGVSAFVRLMNNVGSLFSDDKWKHVLLYLKIAAAETVPDYAQIAYSLVDSEPSDVQEEDPIHISKVFQSHCEACKS
jgi:brefeldin A-inhibited guanine nucleotide-exchange protein